jgi:integrase
MVSKFSTPFLQSIRPKRGRPTTVIYDDIVGGLSIRYGARGVVEFNIAYRIRGYRQQYRQKLGHFPTMSLDQARAAAAAIKARAASGDHGLVIFTAVGPRPPPPTDMVDAVLTRYAKEQLNRLKTGRDFERLLRTALPADKRIGEVTRSDIRRVVDRHMGQGQGFMANRVHATLGTFFRWCLDRDLITANPLAGMARPMRREPSRDRVLTDAELAAVWNATDTLSPDRRDCIRFLILTGLRRGEAVGLRWSDIGDGELTIPAERSKNNVAFTVPLSPQALTIINNQPRTGELVFGNRLGNLSNYSALVAKTTGIGWRLHDLRRTFASGLQQMGVTPAVIDKCLNHSVVVKGVAAVYLRSQYMPERKAAMITWGDHVAKLIETVPCAAN